MFLHWGLIQFSFNFDSDVMIRPFFTESDRYRYDFEKSLSVDDLTELSENSKKPYTVHCPLVIDTEFQTATEKYKELFFSKNLGSLTITTQIKSIVEEEGLIFCHWDLNKFSDIPKHFPSQSKDSHHVIEDYLAAKGIDCHLHRVTTSADRAYIKAISRKRVFRIVTYSHFAVADFLRCAKGSLRQDMVTMMLKTVKGSKITQGRRLRTEYIPYKQTISKDLIKLDWYIEINGVDYAVEISVVDTSALHGAISLGALAANTGSNADFKDNYTSEEKSDMLTQYIKDPTNLFRNYALGDLVVYDILANNSEKFKLVWEALGVLKYYQIPSLTIGSTVSKIFEGKIASQFEAIQGSKLNDKEIEKILETYTKPASSEILISDENGTKGLLAKVLGGRCFNNRPQNTVNIGVLADIDISGCYGEGLRGQLYPLGRPVIIDYPKHSKTNLCLNLRTFLKIYRHELVAGLWQLWFSVTDDKTNTLSPKPLTLVSSQDFFASYEPPKKWSDLISDTEIKEVEETKMWLELPDHTKIYSHQITNAVLTHDGLQWLENICSRPLKNQILDNSIIVCAEFYPASERCESLEALVDYIDDHGALNTCEFKEGRVSEVVSIDRECRKWFALPLGEFMVDALLLERKKHPKKTPLNTLFKLCTNTLYGVMVSKYFKVSNSCVGQNVTARARLMAWCLEKGLHGHQSITDGAVFDVNRVAYGKQNRKLNDANCTSTNRSSPKELDNRKVIFKPLHGLTKVAWYEDTEDTLEFWHTDPKTKKEICEILNINDAKKRIDEYALIHLKQQFQGLDILQAETTDVYGNKRDSTFVFETKGIVKAGVFHGSANYFLLGGKHDSYGSDKQLIAFRSYKKQRSASPVNFCKALLADVTAIERQNPFIKQTIVKVSEFRQRQTSFFADHVFSAGDSIYDAGILRECSISQYLFMNASQRDSWEKEQTWLKDHFGQSYEAWFTDPQTKKLNYQKMVETLDYAIANGYTSFKSFIDKSKNSPYNSLETHPNFDTYTNLKTRFRLEGLINPDIDLDEDWLTQTFEDYQDYDDNYVTEGILVTEDIDW